jgi:hypothetical protein
MLTANVFAKHLLAAVYFHFILYQIFCILIVMSIVYAES